MYRKLIFYSSFLIINSVTSYNHQYGSWSKTSENQWFDGIHLENLFFLNQSIFKDDDPLPEYPFYLMVEKSIIPSLPSNAFKVNCSMVGVFLSDIQIETISPGAFNDLRELTEIDLSKNKLNQVEDDVFNKVENLIYLNLSYNHIIDISEQSFTGLKKLKYLYLQGNKISYLYHDLFESQTNSLLKLDLSSNRFKEINEIFPDMSHLTHLYLQNNNISNIAPDVLKNLTMLLHLDVSYNNLRQIVLSGPKMLNYLYLQNNQISFLDFNLFDPQKEYLSTVNISSNSLNEIGGIFHGMKNLTYLYLQENNISTIAPDSFQNLTSLQHLDMSYNYIRNLPEYIFSGSESLTDLYLHNNKITFLDANLFASQRHSLIFLNLSSNTLRDTTSAFHELSHLTHLNLQNNQISSTATDSFQGLISLEYLDISHNNLERFQYGLLDHLDHLTHLNFSYNKFEEFPLEHLNYLTYLKELIFNNNKITSLNASEILLHFPSLEKIGLNGNFKWTCVKLVTFVKELRIHKIEVLKGNYFTGHNVRGMACSGGSSASNPKNNTQSKETHNNEIDSKYIDKNLKDLLSIIQERNDNGYTSITILLTINTITLIVITFLLFFFVIKLRRSKHEEQLELL